MTPELLAKVAAGVPFDADDGARVRVFIAFDGDNPITAGATPEDTWRHLLDSWAELFDDMVRHEAAHGRPPETAAAGLDGLVSEALRSEWSLVMLELPRRSCAVVLTAILGVVSEVGREHLRGLLPGIFE